MSDDNEDWEFPKSVQPKPEGAGFDLDRVLASVLSLRSEIPDDAFSAATLGSERAGNGVMIGADGLVLTIGYLITEAASVWLVSALRQFRFSNRRTDPMPAADLASK